MNVYLGKRSGGDLSAQASGDQSNPGDTLYFTFSTFNDSGDSEADTGFAVSDIEVFKNGNPTTRATDSGYSLISDTGQVGDRVGLKRFSLTIFNTTDDTGHYEQGAHYAVAVDDIKIDGKTVRFWAGSFEIGYEEVNVVQINSDTGAAVHLAQLVDEHDTGRLQAEATATLDTGAINQAVWQADASRSITAIRNDTGSTDDLLTLANEHDTGRLDVHATAISDTGINERLGTLESGQATLDASIGTVSTQVSVVDTGLDGVSTRIDILDTGLSSVSSRLPAALVNGRMSSDAVAVDGDTGAATHLAQLADEHDTGRLQSDATVTLDTGAVNQAVWQADASRELTGISDTGLNERLATIETGVNVLDTGLGDVSTRIDVLDTGLGDLSARLDDHDTGINTHLTEIAASIAVVDTGLGDASARIDVLDTGLGDISARLDDHDTGAINRLAQVATAIANTDTGLTNRMVALAASVAVVDTGLGDVSTRIDVLDTGVRNAAVNVDAIDGDTGPADNLGRIALDTGTGSRMAIWLADTILDRDMSSGVDNGSSSVRTVRQALRVLRNRVELDTGAISVYKENDSTLSWQGTLESDTGAIPIKTVNPTGP